MVESYVEQQLKSCAETEPEMVKLGIQAVDIAASEFTTEVPAVFGVKPVGTIDDVEDIEAVESQSVA